MRKTTTKAALAVGVVISLMACGRTNPVSAQRQTDRSAALVPSTSDSTKYTETLYSVRSVRTSRVAIVPANAAGGTGPCSPSHDWPPASVTFAAGFPYYEDQWDLYSYRTRASDGRVVETLTNDVGMQTGCFGVVSRTDAIVTTYFQGEIHVGDVDLVVKGLCNGLRSTPEAGYTAHGCNWTLSGDGYVGGHLVTTSMNADAKPVGWPDAFDPDPEGLHETAFSVLRVWK
jgi:hypothetical protein